MTAKTYSVPAVLGFLKVATAPGSAAAMQFLTVGIVLGLFLIGKDDSNLVQCYLDQKL